MTAVQLQCQPMDGRLAKDTTMETPYVLNVNVDISLLEMTKLLALMVHGTKRSQYVKV